MTMWRSVAVAVMLMAGAAQAEAPRAELNQTLSTLQSTKKNEKELRVRLASSAREVKALRADATGLAADVQAAERRVSGEERRAAQLGRKLATKEADFEARKREYASTVASLLRVQKLPATALIVDSENVHQVLRTARVMQHVNGALAARAAQLRHDMDALEKLRSSADASKKRLARESATLNEKQKKLNRDLAKRQELQTQLGRDLASAQRRVSELSKQSASLQELIGKLESDRAAVAQRRSVPAPSIGQTARGTWKLPVAGKLTHKFGERKNANEKYRGLVLASRGGATVVSPAAGEVVFTGPFRDYGRMVLVKHGNGMISLLAGMGSIAVTLNQSVGAGEPLGGMGAGAVSNLYYELREGSKPVDPARWFASLGA